MKLRFCFKSVLILLAVTFLCFSCKNDSDDENPGAVSFASVSGVGLNLVTLNLGVGNDATLIATVTGTNLSAEDKAVTWTSSDSSVATVDTTGKITTIKVGTSRITATSTKDTTKSAYCDVTVEENTVLASTKNEITVGTSAAAYDFSYTGSEATIYIYSKSGGLNFYGIKVADKTWLVSDLIAETISESKNLTSNGITFTALADSKNTITVEANNATIDGIKYTSRLKTGGGGSQAGRCLKISVTGNTSFKFYAVSSNSSDSRTMIVEVVENNAETVTIVRPSSVSLDKNSISLECTDETPTPTETLTATVEPNDVTTGYDKITWTSEDPSIASVSNGVVTAIKAGSTTITASTSNGKTATCAVTVTSTMATNCIRASDAPIGWASYNGTKDLADGSVTPPDSSKGTVGGYGAISANIKTVSTRSELLSALSGTTKKIIYVNGMIDMTDGMLPAKASESTTSLDSWIKTKVSSMTDTTSYGSVASSVTSLATWKTWYAGGNTNSADESGVYKTARSSLSNDWGKQIKIVVPSNTTIIGLTDESGFKGGTVQLSSVSNVVLRNLIIQDSFDPFPQIEKNDGFNSNWDCIQIESCKYIWIDHCTLQDTIARNDDDFDHKSLSDGKNLKYQVFDGLCDIKRACDFITISYTKFYNHDKTSLIGHSASYTDDLKHQTITLMNNYYLNCNQRLPMVRMATIHILNNLYALDKSVSNRGNSYCIGLREQNSVYAENNCFDTGTTATSNSQGNYYFVGNIGQSNMGTAAWTPENYYSYTPMAATELKTYIPNNSGAGKWTVKQ